MASAWADAAERLGHSLLQVAPSTSDLRTVQHTDRHKRCIRFLLDGVCLVECDFLDWCLGSAVPTVRAKRLGVLLLAQYSKTSLGQRGAARTDIVYIPAHGRPTSLFLSWKMARAPSPSRRSPGGPSKAVEWWRPPGFPLCFRLHRLVGPRRHGDPPSAEAELPIGRLFRSVGLGYEAALCTAGFLPRGV